MNHISGLTYPSGRRIYTGKHPNRAEFTETEKQAHKWPSHDLAQEAAFTLMEAFEVVNPAALKVFTIPCSKNKKSSPKPQSSPVLSTTSA